jgi:cell division protein FtsQ
MEKKRKISVRKIMQMAVTLVVTVGCVIAISSASNKEIKKNITGVDIFIKNDKHKFVDEQMVRTVLSNAYGLDMTSIPVSKMNIRAIEDTIRTNKWVADAQVYIDNMRVLHVKVTQRVPVARIFEETGNSYYIDKSMNTMPTSDRYSYYTTVVTGVPHLNADSMGRSLLGQVAYVVKHIEGNKFWNAQVSQIIMSPDRSFEIVPVLGKQRILLGDTSMLDVKLDNLLAFYKKVMTRIGWDRYEVIDLRYKGQIVASPKLEWKQPADKAMNELQWVETIKAKAAYNKNVFSMDSNNVATVIKQTAPVETRVPVAAAVVVNAGAAQNRAQEKPVAKPVVKPAVVNKPVAKPTPAVQAKPQPKVTAKPVVAKKPAAKPTVGKNATSAKKVTATAASAKKAVKKTTKKDDKKDKNKTTKDKKQAAKQKDDKQKTGKYIYKSN